MNSRSICFRSLTALSVLSAALTFQSAGAGTKNTYSVTVDTYFADGIVREARNSKDGNQFIGCAVYGATSTTAPTYVACSARDAGGNAFYCATYNPSYVLVQAALAVSESSALIINSDSSYSCTYIYVYNSSVNL